MAASTIVVPAGGNFQAALNSAQPGDVITLAAGATYIGNFVLPNKGAITQPITIRSSASDALLPPTGVRITPAYAAQLPKIKSANSVSSLRTAAAANHWTLMFLEFQANQSGYGDIIELGAGDSSQTSLSQVPYQLVLDRVYVHGDPIMGQKRAVALNSSDTMVINSYIADIKAVGQDAQALGGFNGPGNYLIENNYLEAATENVLFGGSDPPIQNLVTTNITFRHNYLSKPLAWRNPIIATPTGVAARAAAGAGALPPGTYFYKVSARVPAGQTTKANSAPSLEVAATLAAGTTGGIALSWTPVATATDYVVYGRTSGGENMYWVTTAPFFTDAGVAGSAGTPASATKWSVKNLFELKNAQDVVVEGNVFENLWVADQGGYPIVFTPRNQGGHAPWVIVQRVSFHHNLVRHTAGGVNILGTDNLAPSQLTNHITVHDNVFDDLTGATWGSGSRPFQIGDGGDAFTIDHNTLITTNSSIVGVYGGTATSPTPITNAVYTNNMSAHNAYGIFGANMSSGVVTINAYWPGSTVSRNILAAGPASKYPAGNFFPTVSAWQADFANYAGGDYHLLPTSIYKNAGTDGTDLGADIDAVNAAVASAISGDDRGATTSTTAVSFPTARATVATLTVATQGPGTVSSVDGFLSCSSASCSHAYAFGTMVTLQAAPLPGFVSAGWSSTDCSSTVVMTMDHSCVAMFIPAITGGPKPGSINLNGSTFGDVFTYNPRTGVRTSELSDGQAHFGELRAAWSANWQVYPADFNGDGLTDFFLYGAGSGEWYKAINDGFGDFTYFAGHWSSGWKIFIADLDGDHHSDVFLSNSETGDWYRAISTGTGVGEFAYVAGHWSPGWQIYPADLNGDGVTDLLLYNAKSGYWYQAKNDGVASHDFQYTFGMWSAGWTITPGDFNGDGRTDFFLSHPDTGEWSIATTVTPSGFTYKYGQWSVGWSFAAGDFNGDAKSDLFLYNSATGWWYEAISDGAGGFALTFGTWSSNWQVQVTDFNADGFSDVLLYNPASGQWYQAVNTGVGTFAYGTGVWEPGLLIVGSTPTIP